MNGQWTEPDIRDDIIDLITLLSKKAEIKALRLADWIGITSSKYYHWETRYRKVNEHNGGVPLAIIGLKSGKRQPLWIFG